jgi:type I restriction enzyme S subunit
MLTPQVTYYRVKDHGKLNHKYLRCYFESELFQKTLHLWAGSGSTRAYIGITEQQKLPVILPHINKQRKIAAIISTYDDLIENDKRRIALLEKMAEEIYREWFVRMRFPGHEKVKFKKGVPEKWKYEKLDDLCSVIKRGISPFYDDSAKGLVINQRCIRDGSIDLSVARGHNTKVPKEKYLQYGDTLINSTGVGTLGRISIVEDSPENLTVDSHITICRADSAKIKLQYLAHSIKRLQEYFEYMATGATGQVELNRSLIASTKILAPETKLQVQFSEIADPIWKKRHLLTKSLKILTNSRDMLLGRLISGKLPVDNLDIQFPHSMQPVEDKAHA